MATLDENFRALLAEFTAGDPMRQGVLWTNLSRREISRRLEQVGTPASRHVVRKLLKKHGLGQRKACKNKLMGAHPDRNGQAREHRPAQGGVSGPGRARAQHRHEEKGADRQLRP